MLSSLAILIETLYMFGYNKPSQLPSVAVLKVLETGFSLIQNNDIISFRFSFSPPQHMKSLSNILQTKTVFS